MSATSPASGVSTLHDRCREHVTFDAGMSQPHVEILRRVIGRMLETPTAQDLAQAFFDEGGSAVLMLTDEAAVEANPAEPDAHFNWVDGSGQVALRKSYFHQGHEIIQQTLPAVLAHELLGHGLWHARAARENLSQAVNHHELDEIYARLVGWLVDIELDGHLSSDSSTQRFLDSPRRFWSELTLCNPQYSLKFSSTEMREVIATLASRAQAARDRRADLTSQLTNSRSWPAVIDHFVGYHGIGGRRMRQLRRTLAEEERAYLRDIAITDVVIATLDRTLENFHAETDSTSQRYLQYVADHPLINRLAQATDALATRLREKIALCPHDPFAELPGARRRNKKRWCDQIDFLELKAMYHTDREQHPDHWMA